jgi:hypothetical protein
MAHTSDIDSTSTETQTDHVALGWSLGTNGLWNALTRCQSKDFKTERGARKWWTRKMGGSALKQMSDEHGV